MTASSPPPGRREDPLLLEVLEKVNRVLDYQEREHRRAMWGIAFSVLHAILFFVIPVLLLLWSFQYLQRNFERVVSRISQVVVQQMALPPSPRGEGAPTLPLSPELLEQVQRMIGPGGGGTPSR